MYLRESNFLKDFMHGSPAFTNKIYCTPEKRNQTTNNQSCYKKTPVKDFANFGCSHILNKLFWFARICKEDLFTINYIPVKLYNTFYKCKITSGVCIVPMAQKYFSVLKFIVKELYPLN